MPLDGLHRIPDPDRGPAVRPENSLIVQSLHSRLGVEPTNGDGFGVGWYGERTGARRCSGASSRPGTTGTCASWPAHIRSRARARARPGLAPGRRCSRPTATRSGTGGGCGCTTARSPASRSPSATWCSRSTPSCIPDIEGSTDSELFFYLALTFGLRGRPARGGRAGGRPDRGRRPAARRAVPDADDRGDDRRRDAVGVPVLQRGPVPVAVPQHRRRARCGRSTRTTRCCTGCPTTPGSSSPNRSAGCAARGGRCPRARASSSGTGRRSSAPVRADRARAGRADAPADRGGCRDRGSRGPLRVPRTAGAASPAWCPRSGSRRSSSCSGRTGGPPTSRRSCSAPLGPGVRVDGEFVPLPDRDERPGSAGPGDRRAASCRSPRRAVAAAAADLGRAPGRRGHAAGRRTRASQR